MGVPALQLDNVRAGYGNRQVLRGVSLTVAPGETVALAGRNGAGKTTAMRVIMGLLPASSGGIFSCGQALGPLETFRRARAGMTLVPETRDIFPSLTVGENLLLAEHAGRTGIWTREKLLSIFPSLAGRLSLGAGYLSGGEQQMLSIARALLLNPHLLLLDEPTGGLSASTAAAICTALERIRGDISILVAEQQDLSFARRLADRVCFLGDGVILEETTWSPLRERV